MTTLGDLAREEVLEFSDGYRTKRNEHATVGFRILRAGDVRDGRIHLDGPDFVDVDYAQAIGSKVAREGDVVLTTKGTVGRAGLVAALTENVVYSPQVCYFRSRRPDVIDLRFLHHWLSSPEFTDQAGYLKSSTDMAPYISLRDLASTRIELPPLPTQRAIAEVLGALDDKIAANRSVADACDELRRVRYVALLGEDSRPLSELARFVNGRAYTKNATGAGRVVIRIAELNSGIGGSTVYNELDVPDDNLARPGDLLFAWSGSLTAARWYRAEAIVNQHIFKVIPNHPWPTWLVACAVDKKLADFKAIAADKATTMGHIQRRHLDEPVGVPDRTAIVANDDAMTALWGRALAAEIESLHLAEIRDTLLPHLMSGRITVRDAEKQVEEVL